MNASERKAAEEAQDGGRRPASQWQNGQLAVVTQSPRGKSIRAYSLSPDGKQLYVITKMENERFKEPADISVWSDDQRGAAEIELTPPRGLCQWSSRLRPCSGTMVRFVPYRRASSETPHSLLVARTGPPILSWSCGGNRLRLIRASTTKSNSVRLHGVKRMIGWWFILFQLIGRCGWV